MAILDWETINEFFAGKIPFEEASKKVCQDLEKTVELIAKQAVAMSYRCDMCGFICMPEIHFGIDIVSMTSDAQYLTGGKGNHKLARICPDCAKKLRGVG